MHIARFIQEQKPMQPPKRHHLPSQQLIDSQMQFGSVDCFFEDNLVYRWIWEIDRVVCWLLGSTFFKRTNWKNDFYIWFFRKLRKRLKYNSCSISPIRNIPTQPQPKPIDAQYVGDDFFLALMNMDPVQQPIPEGETNFSLRFLIRFQQKKSKKSNKIGKTARSSSKQLEANSPLQAISTNSFFLLNSKKSLKKKMFFRWWHQANWPLQVWLNYCRCNQTHRECR